MPAQTRAQRVAQAAKATAKAAAQRSSTTKTSPSKKRSHPPGGSDDFQPSAKKVALPGKHSGLKVKAAAVKNRTIAKPAATTQTVAGLQTSIASDIDSVVKGIATDPVLVLEEAADIETGLEDVLELNFEFAYASEATKAAELEGTNAPPTITLRESLGKRELLAGSIQKEWHTQLQAGDNVGRGLNNLTGALCYRHSLFQALFHVPQFVNWLRQHSRGDCVADNRAECVTCCVRDLAQQYWTPTVKTAKITSKLTEVHKIFKNNDWETDTGSGHADPEEQMIWMMNQMSDELPSELFTKYHAFRQLKLQWALNCSRCGETSRKDEELVDFLQVSINPPVEGNQLERMIKNYMFETINDYKCDKCFEGHGEVAPAHRVQKIVFAPDILMITLKRIKYDRWGPRKDTRKVNYLESLDLKAHRAYPKRGDLKYNLKAVISHAGDADFGHYRCIAKSPSGEWVDFNDGDVIGTDLEEALDPTLSQPRYSASKNPFTPHMLFYQRDHGSLP